MGKRVPQKQKDQFALELKAWRARRRFTQAEAAKFLGVPSVRTLQNWEVGRTRPVGVALALIRILLQPKFDLVEARQLIRIIEKRAPMRRSTPPRG